MAPRYAVINMKLDLPNYIICATLNIVIDVFTRIFDKLINYKIKCPFHMSNVMLIVKHPVLCVGHCIGYGAIMCNF